MGPQSTAVMMLDLQNGIALSLQDCTLQAAFTQPALGAAVKDRPTLASTEPAVHAPHALSAVFHGRKCSVVGLHVAMLPFRKSAAVFKWAWPTSQHIPGASFCSASQKRICCQTLAACDVMQSSTRRYGPCKACLGAVVMEGKDLLNR